MKITNFLILHKLARSKSFNRDSDEIIGKISGNIKAKTQKLVKNDLKGLK